MRMSAEPLKAWLILDNDGAIKTGHCTCMAGAGECCSHVAAIAFVLEFTRQKPETLAVTDRLSQWTVPTLSRKIEPKPMKNVNWGNAIKTKAFNGKLLIDLTFKYVKYIIKNKLFVQMQKILKYRSPISIVF